MKPKKTKRLSGILTRYSFAILLLFNAVTAVCIAVAANMAISEKSNDYMYQTQKSARVQVEGFMQRYSMLAQTMASDPELQQAVSESKQDTPMGQTQAYRSAAQTMRGMMESYPDILGIAVGSLAENKVYLPDTSAAPMELSRRPYYETAKTGQAALQQPYQEILTGETCVSVSVPIYKTNGQPGGVLCMQLHLDALSQFVKELAFGQTGQLMLVSADDIVIGFSDSSLLGKNFSELGITSSRALEELSHPTGTVFSYAFNGEKTIGSITSLEQLGWKLLIGLSGAEYQQDAVFLVVLLCGLLLLDVAVTAFLLRTILEKRLKPVGTLKSALEQLQKGNLDIQIQRVYDDEIGEMASMMNDCAKTLSSYVQVTASCMKALEKGDLTVKCPMVFEGDFAPIQTSIEGFIEKMSTILAEQSAAASEQLSGQAEHLKKLLSQFRLPEGMAGISLEEMQADVSEILKQGSDGKY